MPLTPRPVLLHWRGVGGLAWLPQPSHPGCICRSRLAPWLLAPKTPWLSQTWAPRLKPRSCSLRPLLAPSAQHPSPCSVSADPGVQLDLVPMGCSHMSQERQGWCSAEKGANPFATSRQQQLFALLGQRGDGVLGVRLITQQAGGLQRDISGKQELQQSSNILMSRGIATVGQSSN